MITLSASEMMLAAQAGVMRTVENLVRGAQGAHGASVALASKVGESSFFPDPDRQAGKEMRGVRNMVRWAQTGRGGTQFDMLKMMDDGPVCTSIYGLCE